MGGIIAKWHVLRLAAPARAVARTPTFLSPGAEEADTPKPVRIGVRTINETIHRKYPSMDIPQQMEDRLVDLEVKAAYADDLLDQLSDQIYRQQQQIDLLLHELRLLRERLPEAGSTAPRNLRDDIPPHY